MDWQRRRQIITSLFVAGIALLTVMAAVTVTIDYHSVEDSADLSDLRDQSEAATNLLVALIDIETGVRGYLIAGDPTYLEPYYRGRNMVDQIRAEWGSKIDAWTAPGSVEEPLGKLVD